jgi:hypothetical protein
MMVDRGLCNFLSIPLGLVIRTHTLILTYSNSPYLILSAVNSDVSRLYLILHAKRNLQFNQLLRRNKLTLFPG